MSNAHRTAADLYRTFLQAFNDADYDTVRSVIAPGFVDHHPGFEITSQDTYLEALVEAHKTLAIHGELLDIIDSGDKVVTRVRLHGVHQGPVLGVEATGRQAQWETTEIWQVADGVFTERWATDDLLGLKAQLTQDEANVAVVQRVSDAVNAHRYDELNELFGPGFVDHNPAWDVESLSELKGIIVAAHEALDFRADLDGLYPAEGQRVIMHITFTGRHVGRFFGIEPTGKEVSWTSVEVYRLADGKVVERWTQADTAGLMAQLGVPIPN
ncbi:ester cyclase [Micromonospora sp. WMMD714]|uniref:ester cyclase n=1 Tax=Micromonospora sp. WMMD714 TaxID=3016097 RepID=UPI002499FF81|nr:ester cyclase [Micromonospora sp. WMMD714]WFE62843.1 ester cyclase [Micromonospora sp. WMMD714]